MAEITVGRIDAVAVAHGLLLEHYREVCTRPDLMSMDVDWDQFRALERAGMLLTILAHVDGQLVGYSVTMLLPKHLHYRGFRYAQNDLLFVAAAHRKGGTGKALIQRTIEVAKLGGYRAMIWHAKEGTALEAVLRRMGHVVQDIWLMKEL